MGLSVKKQVLKQKSVRVPTDDLHHSFLKLQVDRMELNQTPLDLTTVQVIPVKRIRLAAGTSAPVSTSEQLLLEPLREVNPNYERFLNLLNTNFASVETRVAALLRVLFSETSSTPEVLVCNIRNILRSIETCSSNSQDISSNIRSGLPIVLTRLLLAVAERLCQPKESTSIQHFVLFLHEMLRLPESRFPVYLRLACLESLDTLGVFFRGDEGDDRCYNDTLQLLYSMLQDNCPHIRARVLDLLGAWGGPDLLNRGISLSQLILWMIEDEDARVRERAFACFLKWHSRGIQLQEDLYELACQGVYDEEESVRCTCIKLIWTLAQLFPDSKNHVLGSASPASDEQDDDKSSIRLVDDGFSRVCTAILDPSVRVRALAASLVGSLHQVSEKYLLQTLDQQIMSDLRKKKSIHERVKEGKAEWAAAGRQSAPSGDSFADANDEMSLLSVGACGAVVHGLEDEFAVVRNATIDSVCELAMHCPNFAVACQDCLVVMLTDDLESIRLNAVHSLRKLARSCLLRADQLDIILGALRESSGSLRRALHDLLSESRLSSAECLSQLINGLLKNMDQYGAHDRYSLFRCASKVGAKHPQFVNITLSNLVSSHPYLVGMEPQPTDPNYICVLLCVLNAAREEPTLQASFPKHVLNNYPYMKEAYPDLMPDRDIFEVIIRQLIPEDGQDDDNRTGDRFQSTQKAFTKNILGDTPIIPGEQQHNELMESDLPFSKLIHRMSRLAQRRLSTVQPLASGATSVMEFYNQTVMRLRHLMHYPCPQIVTDLESIARLDPGLASSALCLRDWCRAVLRLKADSGALQANEEAIQDTLRVEFLYTGLSASDNRLVRKLRSQLTKRLQYLRAGDADPNAETPFDWTMLTMSSPVRLVKANFLDGYLTRLAASGEECEFMAPMSLALPVAARVDGMERPADHVEIWLRIADKRIIRWVPPSHHWQMRGPTIFELRTNVHLSSCHVWSEPAEVSIYLNFVVEGRKLDLCEPLRIKIRPQAPLRI